MEQIRLDLIPGKSAPVCHASQYDVGRTIRLNLVEGGSEYSIPSGTTAEIHIRKPDNNIISAAVTATQGNKYIDIVTAEQWTACAGTNLCEIVLTNGGNVIGTINFILEVEMDPIDGGSASETVIYNIQNLVDNAIATSWGLMQWRGKFADLGYTSIASANKAGYYTFTSADAANITDLPTGFTSGGYVITLKLNSGAYQFVGTNRVRYVRNGFTGTWYPDVTTDTTLTKSTFAADAKVVGDKFAELAIKDDCYCQYNTGTYSTSDARLRIWMPKKKGFLMVDMRHYAYTKTTGIADVWGIDNAYVTGTSRGTNLFTLTNNGEWEMAVRLTGASDFSGGGTHGDEKNCAAKIFINGIEKQFSDLTSETAFTELRFIQTSEVYSPTEDGNSQLIAYHGTEYIYTKENIRINQYLQWVGASEVTNTFMAMFPSRKTGTYSGNTISIFDRIYANTDYSVYSPTDNTSKVFAKASSADIYSGVSGVNAKINLVEYPFNLPGGNQVSETDNGGNNYFKLYFPVTSSASSTTTAYTTTAGEVWKSTVDYTIEVNKGSAT